MLHVYEPVHEKSCLYLAYVNNNVYLHVLCTNVGLGQKIVLFLETQPALPFWGLL